MLQYLEHQNGVKIAVDYFSCTFPLKLQEDELELIVIEDLVKYIGEFLNFEPSEINKEEYSTNRFRYQYTIGNSIILRLSGPELLIGYRSCQIELKGQGCREFENRSNKTWNDLFSFFLIRLHGNPTRIDIAIDDYDGTHSNITKIKEILDKGNYTTSFRKKYYKLMGCEQEGWTLQFGSHKSTIMLVIYDKLKEQISKGNEVNQEFWTRYELRYMKDRAYDVVLNYIEQGEENFNKYSYGLLYSMLDLKKENNYSEHNIMQADTISWWKHFLQEVEKSEIVKYKIKSNNIDTYKAWVLPIITTYFIVTYLHNGRDFNLTYIKQLEEILGYIEKVDKKKVKKINNYQEEVAQTKISIKDINDLQSSIKEYISLNLLPF